MSRRGEGTRLTPIARCLFPVAHSIACSLLPEEKSPGIPELFKRLQYKKTLVLFRFTILLDDLPGHFHITRQIHHHHHGLGEEIHQNQHAKRG